MKKMIMLMAILILFVGCAIPASKAHTEYAHNGQAITIGITPQEVREIMGTPVKIERPGESYMNRTASINVFEGQTHWHYGELLGGNGDGKLIVIFKDNMAIDIRERQ